MSSGPRAPEINAPSAGAVSMGGSESGSVERGSFNPFTLSFYDRDAERAFLSDHAAQSLNLVRLSLLFAACLYLLFSILDVHVVPQVAPTLLIIRAAGAVFLTIVAIFSVIRRARRYFQLTMSLVIIVAGTGVVALVTIVDGAGWHNYYGGVILAIIYAHVLLRLRFVYATMTSWYLIGLYWFASMQIAHVPENVAMNSMFHLVSANILGMFGSYGLETYARKVYLKTRMLDESQHRLSLEYDRTMSELAAVREIQLSMLPRELPQHASVDLDVWMATANEVGGDYYDVVRKEDGVLVFAIGDATGHGARAGALVTAAKLLFATYATCDDPAKFLRRASHSLRAMRFPKLYMTMAMGHARGTTLEIAGAGMPPALHYRASRLRIEYVHLKGIPLGAPYDGNYTVQEIQLEPEDVVVLMSDGFPELFSSSDAMLGNERIEQELARLASLPVQQIVSGLASTVMKWRDGAPLRDDVTVLALKVKRPENQPAG